jgi:mannan endo-1,4-beta-mannosidase
MRTRHLMLIVTIAIASFLGYAVTVDRTPATRTGQRTAIPPAMAALGQAPTYDPAHLLTPDRKYLGVAIAGAPRSMAGVHSFAKVMRAKPNIITIYEAFGDGYAAAEVRRTYDYGALAIVRWEPFDATLADIAAGRYDAYVASFAESVRALNLPVALTFAHEMNGFWYPWGAPKNKARTFVTAWRRLHDIFEQVSATNVIWTWTPNVISGAPSVELKPYYPGDAYVDWIGLDGYYTRTGAQTYRQLFDPTMKDIRRFTRLPFLIVETGAEPGWRRPGAVRDLFDSVARDKRMLGFVYFNQKGTKRWEIDDDPAVTAVYRVKAKSLPYGFTVS